MKIKKGFEMVLFEELLSKEKKSLISGPFGSNISAKYFVEDGIPVIRGNNLSLGYEKFKDTGFAFVTDEKAKSLNCYARINDIVFTAVGTLGQVGIIHDELKYKEYVISNKQLRATLNPVLVLPIYAFYWFSSPWMIDLIKTRNVGSTVPLLNLSIIRKLPVLLPQNIDHQKGIVKVLSDLDSKIKLNNKINKELESMAKLIYDYWFVQFDFPISEEQAAAMGKPELKGKPYKSSGGKMVFSEELKREIPEGWVVKEIEEVADLKAGGDKPKFISKNETTVHKVPIYSNGVTNEGLYGFTDVAKIIKQSITISARGTIGYTAIRMNPFVPIIRLIAVTPKESKMLQFFYESIKELNFENSGSVQKQLTVPMISKLKILIPSKNVLNEYDEIVSPQQQKIECNKKENQKLSELRDWLLPMLMNGQVTVGEAEEYVAGGDEVGLAAEEKGKYRND